MATHVHEFWLAPTDYVAGTTSSGLSYANPDFAKGSPDSSYAQYASSTGGSVTCRGYSYSPNIPSDATITGLRYKWYNNEAIIITATCRIFDRATQAVVLTGTASFSGIGGYDFNVSTITPALVNNMEPIMTISGAASSRRRLDAFGVDVTYTTPEPAGPQTKVFRNGTWTSTSVKKLTGTTWSNAIIKKI